LYWKLALALIRKCLEKVQEILGVVDPPLRKEVYPQMGVAITLARKLTVSVPILILAIFLILPFDFGTIFLLEFRLVLRMLRILPVQQWTSIAFAEIFSPKLIIVVW
jgi:hypothetical protein